MGYIFVIHELIFSCQSFTNYVSSSDMGNDRGSYNSYNRGGGGRGGYSAGFGGNQGGYQSNQGSYGSNQGGYQGNQGGYNRGGYQGNQGGFVFSLSIVFHMKEITLLNLWLQSYDIYIYLHY